MKKLIFLLLAMFVANVAAAQSGYRPNPGDSLSIEVLQDSNLNRQVLVLPGGSISFPFVGGLSVNGQTVEQIAARISAALAPQFASPPDVFVSVASLKPEEIEEPEPDPVIDVFYLGEWNQPGAREVAPDTTMLQALAQGGGFTNFAAQKRIQLRRTDPATGNVQTFLIDYAAIADGTALVRDFGLVDGDVLVAPERRLFE